MDAGLSPARHARAQHRYELRTLTYLTLDDANGGVIRNVTYGGIGAQVVTAVRPRQQLRVRFELRYPRLRVEARAEVVWATFSGQCGLRFLDLPPEITRQLNTWIFGDLLEEVSLRLDPCDSIFSIPAFETAKLPRSSPANGHATNVATVDDGLLVSPAPVKVIELPPRMEMSSVETVAERFPRLSQAVSSQLDWLSQPLSSRGTGMDDPYDGGHRRSIAVRAGVPGDYPGSSGMAAVDGSWGRAGGGSSILGLFPDSRRRQPGFAAGSLSRISGGR